MNFGIYRLVEVPKRSRSAKNRLQRITVELFLILFPDRITSIMA